MATLLQRLRLMRTMRSKRELVTLQRSEGYGITEIASRSTTRLDEADKDNGNDSDDWRTLSEAKNIWNNSAIRTTLYAMSAPIRWVGRLFRARPETKK